MRYGVAIWNYQEEGVALPRLAEELAGFGFDALSFLPGPLVKCEEPEARDLLALMQERGLVATVHGGFDMTRGHVETIVSRYGGCLRALTFDAAWTADSCGMFYDGPRMAPFLLEVEEVMKDTSVQFAVEDFPLDSRALERHRADLGPLLDCPRYGILIDVGHLNLRLRRAGYFKSQTPAEYIRRVPVPIIEIHVHDNAGETDSHGHIGFGNVDFEEVARGLREVGFDGISTIEIAPSFHGSTPGASKPRAKESLEKWRTIWESTAPAAPGSGPGETRA